MLEQYPIETVQFITDPRTGIQRRCKWPPSIAEVVEAADEHLRHRAKVNRFKNWGISQWGDERDRGPRELTPIQKRIAEHFNVDEGEMARMMTRNQK